MAADLTLATWLSSLLIIIFIDLVLAGDNAIVIALAANRLPQRLQRRAVIYGTACAIVVRVLMTLAVFWLIKIPLLRALGGIILFWIAYRMMTDKHEDERKGREAQSIGEAIRIIVVADTVMGFDNILAVSGAARGDFTLIVIGLLISIPIMVWGSLFLLRMIRSHPWIVIAGGAVLAYVGASMIMDDPWVVDMLGEPSAPARLGAVATMTALCTATAWIAARRQS